MKKEKKGRLSSRRKRSLRRVLIAAAAVLLVNRIFLIGLLFPIQAIRHFEERQGTGRTAVVCRDWAPEIHGSHLLYLTENENVLMLSGTYLTVYGWMDAFGVAADCTPPAPIHGGWWSMAREGRTNLVYAFCRLEDPEIVRLEVLAEYEDGSSGQLVRQSAFRWDREWVCGEEDRHVLFRKRGVDWSAYPSPLYLTAIGYDIAGNEIARVELDQGASSNFG